MASLLKSPEKGKEWVKTESGAYSDAPAAAGGDEESDDDFVPAARAGRRGGVSAGVIDFDAPFEKVVIAKDDVTMRALKTTVQANVLFEHLEKDELADVLDAMFPVDSAKGMTIIEQGDDGDNFYIIKSGVCGVEINGKEIAEIPAGGGFGELALMYGTPRAATIRAKTDCSLFGIDRDTYCRILMGATIKKREVYEAFLGKVKLLKDLDKFERLTIADAVSAVDFEAGTDIITEGHVGNDFFMIMQGTCTVTKNGAEVGTLSEADYFGEIALLTGDTRKATVTAKTAVACVRLDRDRFERVLGPCKEILMRDMTNYTGFMG